MKKPKLTQWFDGKLKPVRKGFYERKYSSPRIFGADYWDGENWRYCHPKGVVASLQTRAWRGLAKKP